MTDKKYPKKINKKTIPFFLPIVYDKGDLRLVVVIIAYGQEQGEGKWCVTSARAGPSGFDSHPEIFLMKF